MTKMAARTPGGDPKCSNISSCSSRIYHLAAERNATGEWGCQEPPKP